MQAVEQLSPDLIRPLKRVEYDRLVEAGVFEDERVELLFGRLVHMSPQRVPHATAIRRLVAILHAVVGRRGCVQSQLPLVCAGESEPEPDIAVLPRSDFGDQHPDEALLVVEVAESSLEKDRRVKGPLYARSGFPEYWLVNLKDRIVEVHTDPGPDGYRQIAIVRPGEVLEASAVEGLSVAVDEILPAS